MKKLILLLLIPILMQGQTTLEKFEARQDSVMKANRERIERLKECKGYYPPVKTNVSIWVEPDSVYIPLEDYFGRWLIGEWDSYAKECASTYTYIVKTYWLEQPVLEFPDYESFRKWNATWGDNYKAEVQSKQPDPIEFITVFLRNKLGEK